MAFKSRYSNCSLDFWRYISNHYNDSLTSRRPAARTGMPMSIRAEMR
jgi:hypothetical protein